VKLRAIGLALTTGWALAAGLAVAASAKTPVAKPARPKPVLAAPTEWLPQTQVLANGNFLLGDPAAKVRLAEYISYTCPFCARFQQDSADAMRRALVGPGKVVVEVRHVVRDPVDLAVAVLVRCGDRRRFYARHDAFLREQATWIAPLRSSTGPQRLRWANGPMPQRLRAVVDDFNLYPMMARLGVDRATVDACLADEALTTWLDSQTDVAIDAGVRSTPSFMLDGAMVDEAHDWQALEPPLRARL